MIPLATLFNMNKLNIKDMNSEDLMYASDEAEFYYVINGKETDIAVPEGEVIGLDIETPDGVELQLFSNMYWSPAWS
jgi:hypothetical protein